MTLSRYCILDECFPFVCDVICCAKDNGEMAKQVFYLDAFEKCKVVLCNANSKPKVDDNRERITVIAYIHIISGVDPF